MWMRFAFAVGESAGPHPADRNKNTSPCTICKPFNTILKRFSVRCPVTLDAAGGCRNNANSTLQAFILESVYIRDVHPHGTNGPNAHHSNNMHTNSRKLAWRLPLLFGCKGCCLITDSAYHCLAAACNTHQDQQVKHVRDPVRSTALGFPEDPAQSTHYMTSAPKIKTST